MLGWLENLGFGGSVVPTILTIGTESSEASTVNSVGTGPNWSIVLAAAPTRTIVVGDILTDNGSNDFLITAVASQTAFTVIDYKTSGDPVTGAGTTGRSDANLTNAEADIGSYAASGGTIEFRCYNDGTLDDKLILNDTTLGAGGTLTITVPVGERHDGSAGTGFSIDPSANGNAITLGGGVQPAITVEFIEILGVVNVSALVAVGIFVDVDSGSGATILQNLIIHDFVSANAKYRAITLNSSTTVRNCLLYDIRDNGTNADDAGIRLNSSADASIIHNCTIRNCDIGIADQIGAANIVLQNTVIMDCDDAVLDSGTFTGSGNNASDEASMPGSNNKVNLTSSDQFISLTDGFENYQLKQVSDLLDAGLDLSGIVDSDIVGLSRPKNNAYDIGAFELNTLQSLLLDEVSGGYDHYDRLAG